MKWSRLVLAAAVLALLCSPAMAGSLGVYGSYWNSDQANDSTGGGARVGFSFIKFLELDVHGTYYSSFTTDVNGQSVDVKAKPVDAGLRVNFFPSEAITPYVGAGFTRYFLEANQGSIEDKNGIYGQAGLELGGGFTRFFVEGLWRKMETSVSLASFDRNTKFDGFAANAGITWRWGK